MYHISLLSGFVNIRITDIELLVIQTDDFCLENFNQKTFHNFIIKFVENNICKLIKRKM